MNPKDMTKEQIVIGLSDALRVEINENNEPDDRVYALNYRRQMEAELLRRLDEADVLRKENEELKAQNLLIRGDNADLLAKADAYSFNISYMHTKISQMIEENEKLRKALSGLLQNAQQDGDTRLAVQKSGNIITGLDAAKAKESEASNE